jgi:hypothetical protein
MNYHNVSYACNVLLNQINIISCCQALPIFDGISGGGTPLYASASRGGLCHYKTGDFMGSFVSERTPETASDRAALQKQLSVRWLKVALASKGI